MRAYLKSLYRLISSITVNKKWDFLKTLFYQFHPFINLIRHIKNSLLPKLLLEAKILRIEFLNQCRKLSTTEWSCERTKLLKSHLKRLKVLQLKIVSKELLHCVTSICQLETKNTMVYLLRKSFREPRRKLGNLPEKSGFLRKIYVIFVLIDWSLQNRI